MYRQKQLYTISQRIIGQEVWKLLKNHQSSQDVVGETA